MSDPPADHFSDSIRDECAALIRQAATARQARLALARAQEIVSLFPDELDAHLAFGTILNLTRLRTGNLEAWTAIHERFPTSFRALQQRITALARERRVEDARHLVETFRPDTGDSAEALLERAELFVAMSDMGQAATLFERVLTLFPDHTRGRVLFARRLSQHGRAVQARECIAPLCEKPSPPHGATSMMVALDRGLAVMRRMAPERLERGDNTNLIALGCLLTKFATRRPRILPPRRIGATALITGSLGPGGAERQMAGTVKLLAQALKNDKPIGTVSVDGPIHLVVKSLARDDERDFFLHEVADEQVSCHEIDDMPSAPLTDGDVEDPDVLALLPFLGSAIGYGVARLVTWFRQHKVDVAYIWQDGAILFSAVAALLAGVPRIILCMRGLPPNVRLHLFKPEYDELYKGLLHIPGTALVSNTRTAAAAYSEWLDCPPKRFHIIRNGVKRLAIESTPADVDQWLKFERKTAGADHTVGSVFRMDIDKRPLTWIDFAAYHLRRRPGARFVLVGKGMLFAKVVERAREYGISDRILFVGRSHCVGFWLTKLDAFLLLSQFEGLPNVLIEAQLAGVGVVTTPAGGACETFVEGVTGLSTGTINDLDLFDVSTKVDWVISKARLEQNFSRKTRQIAQRRFSSRAMLGRTARVLAGGRPEKPINADVHAPDEDPGGFLQERKIA